MRRPEPIALPPLPPGPDHVWRIPGSKSLTNRALALAALAEGTSCLLGPLDSDDTRHMQRGLAQLGIVCELDDERWLVHGGRRRLRASPGPVFVGNSGTTVRFLTALATLIHGQTILEGDGHMARRPIRDLVNGLRALGVQIDCASGCPPLTVHGGRLPGGLLRMQGARSSQYFSALLMAGAGADGPLTIGVEGELVSRPYVDMTLALIRAFGGSARACEGLGPHPSLHFEVLPATYQAGEHRIEPDASAASYAFAAAIATRGRITVPDLGTTALQGDLAFLDLLALMGAQVERGRDNCVVSCDRQPVGIEVDMHHISDTAMTLAALAPLCDGPTTIRNIGNIRIKETDRLAALVTELRRLGQEVDHGEDWLRICPRPLQAASVECYADHRMAMSFAVLGLALPGITISDPGCVDKTYPGFWRDLRFLYRRQGLERPW